jgi:hypothetical protein
LNYLFFPYSEEQGMKEMQEMRAMLDKLNIGNVTPAITSSPTNAVSLAREKKNEKKKKIINSTSFDATIIC